MKKGFLENVMNHMQFKIKKLPKLRKFSQQGRGSKIWWGNSQVLFGNLPQGGRGVGPGDKIPLNFLELILLGIIYTLTYTIVKCDTPEFISIHLTPKICWR